MSGGANKDHQWNEFQQESSEISVYFQLYKKKKNLCQIYYQHQLDPVATPLFW